MFGGWATTENGIEFISSDIWSLNWTENRNVHVTHLGFVPTDVCSAAAVNHCDVNVIIIGGIQDTRSWASDQVTQIKDFVTDLSASTQRVPMPRAYNSGVIVDNIMYVFGGQTDNKALDTILVCPLDGAVCDEDVNIVDIWWKRWEYLLVVVLIVVVLIIMVIFFVYRCTCNNNNQRGYLQIDTQNNTTTQMSNMSQVMAR